MIYKYMKRTPLRKKGKVGKINQMINQKIKQFCIDNDIRNCEVKLNGCMNHYVAAAHLHNRHYYRGKNAHLLSDPSNFVMACQYCHKQLDDEMTQEEKQKEFDRVIANRGKVL